MRSPERKIAASCRGVPALRRIAVPADRGPVAHTLLVEWEAVRTDVAEDRHIALHRLDACARRLGGRQPPPRRQRRATDTRRARGGHDRSQRAHPARIVRGHGLGDHPAHRDAGQVRILVAEHVEQADGVARHVAEVVLPRMVASAQDGERLRRRKVHVRGPADVAIVEPGDAVAAAGQRGGEVGRPRAVQLLPQAADEHDRRIVRVTDLLVAQLDAAADVDDVLLGSSCRRPLGSAESR